MDPNTRAKMILSSNPNPEELTSIVPPCQLLKEYGGQADPPEKFWPPAFPPGFRDDFVSQHYAPEEFKKELIAKAQMMPSPELAQFVRNSRRGKDKKGIFPWMSYRLTSGIQRRDSFNGIIGDTEHKVEPEVKKIEKEDEKTIEESNKLINEHNSKSMKEEPKITTTFDKKDKENMIIKDKELKEEVKESKSDVVA